MDINVRCPHCHEALAISDDEIDLRVDCPVCGKTFVWGEILRAEEDRKRQLRAEREAKQQQILEKRKQEQARQLEERGKAREEEYLIKEEIDARLQEKKRSVFHPRYVAIGAIAAGVVVVIIALL